MNKFSKGGLVFVLPYTSVTKYQHINITSHSPLCMNVHTQPHTNIHTNIAACFYLGITCKISLKTYKRFCMPKNRCTPNRCFTWGPMPHVSQSLQRRQNECDDVSNHRRLDWVLNRLFRHWSKKTPKLRVTGLSEGNSLVTGEFPS